MIFTWRTRTHRFGIHDEAVTLLISANTLDFVALPVRIPANGCATFMVQ